MSRASGVWRRRIASEDAAVAVISKAHLVWALFVAALAGTVLPACVSGPSSADPVRPNIIFLLTDDQRADSLSVAGHAFAQTPNIDQLAQRGIRYSNAFTVAPICAPSRFAFLSGQYERVNGLGFNSPYEVSERQWQQTYPALLQQAGYYTGFIGKFGVQFYSLAGGAALRFDYWRAHDGWLPFFPDEHPENPATAIYRDASKRITTEIMGEYIEEFLRTRPDNQPFNLSVSFSAPHNSVVSSMYEAGADPDCDSYACRVMAYPASDNPRLTGHPVYDRLYREADIVIAEDTGKDPYRFIPQGVIDHEARRKWYDYNYEAGMQPEHLIRYQQTVTGIDRVVGDLTEQLQRLGIADNTIIIYSSDHGLLNGEYGTGGKALLYDLVAKIPLIVYDPRESAADTSKDNSELVLSIDIPATILSYAGLAAPAIMQGRDLNAGLAARKEVFLESLTVAEGNPFIEAVRTQDWKYVRYLQPAGCPYKEAQLDFSKQAPVFEQLFNLRNDPAERDNLASVAEYADTLDYFRQRAAARSIELTRRGREYKQAIAMARRPEEGEYCW